MKNVPMKIEQLGFNKWFLDRIDPAKLIDHQIARLLLPIRIVIPSTTARVMYRPN